MNWSALGCFPQNTRKFVGKRDVVHTPFAFELSNTYKFSSNLDANTEIRMDNANAKQMS